MSPYTDAACDRITYMGVHAMDMGFLDKQVRLMLDGLPRSFWDAKDRDPREDLHALFGYPAMMVPAHQSRIVEEMRGLDHDIVSVLDPFAGAGTTMTASMQAGLNYCGQDINPLAVLICKAKRGLCQKGALQAARDRIRERIEYDCSNKIEACFPSIDKWFGQMAQISLSKLRRAIRAETDVKIRRFFWVVLAETVRRTSRSRTSTFKLHIRPKDEWARLRSPRLLFDELATRSIIDADTFYAGLEKLGHQDNGVYRGSIGILLADSAQGIVPVAGKRTGYDLVLTSPPYGDNVTTVPYGQQAYLPLQWIDSEDIAPGLDLGGLLSTTHEIDRQSLGGSGPIDMTNDITHLSSHSQAFAQTAARLCALPPDRLRRVTRFMRDLDKCLPHIVGTMRPNAYAICFIGNRHVGKSEVPTRDILQQLAGEHGLLFVHGLERRLSFRRMATHNQISNMIRSEHILVFRKSGL